MQIEGRNPVIELLKSKRPVKKVAIEIGIDKENEKIQEIIKRARNRRISIQELGRKKINSMSATKNHQGVIAIAKIEIVDFKETMAEDQRHNSQSSVVYIREALLEDNIGAIARSVEAAGFRGIVIPPKQNLTPQMFRSSMGSLANIKIFQGSLFNTIKDAQSLGMKVVGIEVSGDKYYYEEDLSGPTMFIIGGENKSLSPQITEKCDVVVKIPLHGKINSLNMSVAASIVIFDKVRQTK